MVVIVIVIYVHVLGPNVSPVATVLRGVPSPSAVVSAMVFPYQFKVTPGYERQKKIKNVPTAKAASSPAERI